MYDQLLFFGLVRHYKGLDILLRGRWRVAAARPRGYGGRRVLGGWAETKRDLITELGLAERVSLREGYLEAAELPAVFAPVMPWSALPVGHGSQNALLAFEHDRPVIATRTGALADAVTDGVDGIVCEADDVAALAGGIERFYAPGRPFGCGAMSLDPTPVRPGGRRGVARRGNRFAEF